MQTLQALEKIMYRQTTRNREQIARMIAARDGPMNGARRKAIVHWVARHLRHSTRGNEFAVKKHTRGVQEFTIDGLRIRLTPNVGGEARPEAKP